MKLSDLITEELVIPSLKGDDVSSVLREFADAICKAGKYNDAETIYQRLLEREKQESTGIGNGLAIPHCKVENLPLVVLSIGYSETGVDFKAIDGNPTYFFFVVISSSSAAVLHLRTLAALSRLLKSAVFISQLQQRPGSQELLALIRKQEEGAAVIP